MENASDSSLLAQMVKLSRRMAATRELDPLLSLAIDEVLQLVGAERGYIVLLNQDGSLDFRVKRRRDGTEIEDVEDSISRSILNEVVQTQQPLLVSNAMADQQFSKARSVMMMRLRSVMCVPLLTQKGIIGAIYVENRSVAGRFQPADLPPLELFAGQAAVAIENAALNEALVRANQELQALDEMKNNLVILVSHELRTPITTLYGYMQLLKDDPEPFLIDELSESVDRVVRTIEEIIDAFRIMAGQLGLEHEMTSLHALVGEVLAGFAETCAKRQITLTVHGLELFPVLPVDKKKMHVVLANVISNAIKFTANGGQVTVYGRVLEHHVELCVQDTGIGIPPEEQERIFDLFYVLGSMKHHSTSKHAFRGGGLGLGLPIAKGFVQAHQGDIRIESPAQVSAATPGTKCIIVLPRQIH